MLILIYFPFSFFLFFYLYPFSMSQATQHLLITLHSFRRAFLKFKKTCQCDFCWLSLFFSCHSSWFSSSLLSMVSLYKFTSVFYFVVFFSPSCHRGLSYKSSTCILKFLFNLLFSQRITLSLAWSPFFLLLL